MDSGDDSDDNNSITDTKSEEETDTLVDMILNGSSTEEITKHLKENISTGLNYRFRCWTPLHYATANNRKDICELLVQNGSDVNYIALNTPKSHENCSNNGSSPFMMSCSRAVGMDIFKLLLQNGGNVNSVDPRIGQTSFMYLVSEPDVDCNLCSIKTQEQKMNILLENGGDLILKENYGKNVLHFFDMYTENETEEDQVLEMMKTIINYEVDVNGIDSWGYTPLRMASRVLRPKRMTLLLEHGADINPTIVRDGSTMIHSLRYLNDEDSVTNFYDRLEKSLTVLTNAGLSINSTTYIGNNFIHELILADFKATTVENMIQCGGDLNQRNGYGYTPLHSCLAYKELITQTAQHQTNRLEISEMLIKQGADIKTTNINQMTLLMTVVRKNCPEDVSFVLDRCAAGDVNATDKFERTALHHCVFVTAELNDVIERRQIKEVTENRRILQMLLKAKIDPRIKDFYDKEAIYYTKFLDKESQQYFLELLGHFKEESSANFDSWILYQEKTKELTQLFNITDSSILQDKESVLRDLLYTPGIGSVECIPESFNIKDKVHLLLSEFSQALSQHDVSNFQCNISLSGGVGEGTKVGFPDEYDYLLFVENLSDKLIPEDNENTSTGHVMLKYKEEFTDERFSTNGYFDTSKFTCYFYKLAFDVLSSLSIWDNVGFYWIPNQYDIDNECERMENSANLLLNLEYPSESYGQINITIDIVPVIRLPSDWWPKHQQKPTTMPNTKDSLCAVLMKPAGDFEIEILQPRISTSLIETNFISCLPTHIKYAYIILKILKEFVQFTDNDNNNEKLNMYVDSYIFKNAALKYAFSMYQDYLVEVSNTKECDMMKILDSILCIISNIDVKSFFFPPMSLRSSIEVDIEPDFQYVGDYEGELRKALLENLKIFLELS